MVFVLFGFMVIFAFGIGGLYYAYQRRAIKTAQKILSGQPYEPKLLKRTLRTLATARDNEGKRLYSKLADFAEKQYD